MNVTLHKFTHLKAVQTSLASDQSRRADEHLRGGGAGKKTMYREMVLEIFFLLCSSDSGLNMSKMGPFSLLFLCGSTAIPRGFGVLNDFLVKGQVRACLGIRTLPAIYYCWELHHRNTSGFIRQGRDSICKKHIPGWAWLSSVQNSFSPSPTCLRLKKDTIPS